MPGIARREPGFSGCGDSSDLDIPNLDWATRLPLARRNDCCCIRSRLVKREHAAVQVLGHDLVEDVLEMSASAPDRKRLKAEADLEYCHRGGPHRLE